MTTARNSYATLAEYKDYAKTRGVTAPTDATDDAVIDMMLEAASRQYEDDHYHRQFYPTVETREYDIPERRFVYFQEKHLLELLSFTNGDGSAIASTEYVLEPPNFSPKYGLSLRDSSTVTWQLDSSSSNQQVLSVSALWGFHDRYATDGWIVGSTLSEALDTSELGFDVTSATLFSAGQIIRVENELCIIASIASNTLTVISRGDNGSTAAAHDTALSVRYWSPMTQVKQAVLEMVNTQYQARSQTSIGATNPARRWSREGSKV